MASRDKKGGGDFVLESRHLVGLFMLLVVIFGVVFTLGYLLGRSQYDANLHVSSVASASGDSPPPVPVAKSRSKAENNDTAPPQKESDWDFYHSSDSKNTDDRLQPPPKLTAAKRPPPPPEPAKVAKPPISTGKSSSPADAPLIPKGNIMLQVAAVTSQGDALALAQALQQRKLPAFVIPPSAAPGADKFYRVQVGPYADNKSAMAARSELEAKGFKSILKR